MAQSSELRPVQAEPLAGYRSRFHTETGVIPLGHKGHVATDLYGDLIYLCSAITNFGVHPAKAGSHLVGGANLGWEGVEHGHKGPYDVLFFDEAKMCWIEANGGKPPTGWEDRIVDGGYDEKGRRFWHALAEIQGLKIPGKAAIHLKGALFPWFHQEVWRGDYQILCWKKDICLEEHN
ncbi:hypothetical protein BT69DRAFT_1256096 [Atractiella rhizophila]|nr:hypothetical protein BT69DRAFT_1256096 [Atractiella rhizophila]